MSLIHFTEDALVAGRMSNGKKMIQLTRHEMMILWFLNQNPGGTTWREIAQFLWANENIGRVKTLSVHFFNMRPKLRPKYFIEYDESRKLYCLKLEDCDFRVTQDYMRDVDMGHWRAVALDNSGAIRFLDKSCGSCPTGCIARRDLEGPIIKEIIKQIDEVLS